MQFNFELKEVELAFHGVPIDTFGIIHNYVLQYIPYMTVYGNITDTAVSSRDKSTVLTSYSLLILH